MKYATLVLLLLVAIGDPVSAGPTSAALTPQQRPLKIIVCPAHESAHVKREYLLFVDKLQRELGRRVRLFGVQRYGRLVTLLRRNEVDMGVVSVSALEELEKRGVRDSVRVVAAQVLNNRARYRGVVVVRSKSELTSLDDLAGKTLAIPDYRSYSGWRQLQRWFVARGVTPVRFFSAIEQAGGHVEALQMVLDGDADAAAVSSLTFHAAERQGLLVDQCRPVYKTDQIPFDSFVVSNALDEETARRIVVAVLAFKSRTPVGRVVLEWRRATDESYAP